VRSTLRKAFIEAGLAEVAKPDYEIVGRHDRYVFDFALGNGEVRRFVEALSFDKGNPEDVRSELHATA